MPAPTPWLTWAPKPESKGVINHAWVAKGVGVDELFMVEIDPTTGGIPISLAFDTNWGVVGPGTLRTAAIVGNEMGPADFGTGASGPQTLRVALSSDTPVILGYDTDWGVVGTDTLRTAAQVGNAAGAADFGAGSTSSQTLRVSANVAAKGTELDVNFGAGTTALRVASLLGNATGAVDFDFGVSGAQTMRVAALLGNAAGLIDFGTGNATGQTPRFVLADDQPIVPIGGDVNVTNLPTTVAVNDGVSNASTLRVSANLAYNGTPSSVDFGASTNALRTASILGNAAGAIAYGTGADGAQVPRVTVSTRSEAATTPLAARLSNGTNFLATASGADGADVLRTTLSTRSESAATPLSVRAGDGTNFGLTSNLTAAQQTLSTGNALPVTKDIMMGWDGTNHREVAVDTNGYIKNTAISKSWVGPPLFLDYGTNPVSDTSWTQVVASTSGIISMMQIFDSSGYILKLATGAPGLETEILRITPGGNGANIPVTPIPAGTRLSLQAVVTSTTGPTPISAAVGQFVANTFN